MIFRRGPLPIQLPPRPPDSHRCLLVTNECAPTPGLCQLMAEKCSQGPCEMHILVSRFKRSVLVTDPGLGAKGNDRITVDDQEWDLAEARLDSFMRALGDLGQPLSGEILAGTAFKRIRSLLRIETFDEVVVLAPRRRPRRWLARDLVESIKRASQIPVITIPADELAA